MISQQDRALSRLAVKNHFMDKESVRKCFKEMKRLGAAGEQAVRFEDLAVENGFLSNEQATAISLAYQRLRKDAERRKWSIKGYDIYNKLGEGGLGVVFKAKQVSMNRLVALKILHKRWLNDEEFKQRFLVEARLVGKLSHQNLIKVYDVGREDWKLYFSMEYVEGDTLEQLIEREGPLDTLKAINITLQILRGINYISRYDIVHCDIKPSNILMSNDGTAKLGDFGFVKSNIEIEVTEEGSVLGTPDYIAPEQAMGRELDFRADIYALGVTLYHMVAQKPPFDGTASMIMRSHIKEELPDPREHNPNVNEGMVKIIRKMTAKDPDDRYATCQELFDDFEALRLKEKAGKDSDYYDLSRVELVETLKLEREKTDKSDKEIGRVKRQMQKLRQLLWAAVGVAALAIAVVVALAIKIVLD